MKTSVKRESLLKALHRVCNIVSGKSAMPVLANVLIEAEGSGLTLSTTDIELRLRTSLEATVDEPGRTTLPAKKLLNLVSKFEGETVSLDSDANHHCAIKCGNSDFTLLGLDPEGFPKPADFAPLRSLKLKQPELARIIDSISYAVNLEDSRKALHGLLLSVKDGNLTAVATDGKRLALVEKMLEAGSSGQDGEIIMTQKSANEAKRLLEKDGDAVLEIGERQIVLKAGPTTLSAMLIEGIYPNYRQAIPAAFSKKVEIPCAQFRRALETIGITISDAMPAMKLTLKSGKMLFESNCAGLGEGRQTVEVPYEGDAVEFSLNPDLLSDPFKHMDAEKATMKLNDGSSPLSIESGDGFLYVIMPMRGKQA